MQEYNVTLVYYLTHYLVDIVDEKAGRVLKLDEIDQGRNWLGADLLVFDSCTGGRAPAPRSRQSFPKCLKHIQIMS